MVHLISDPLARHFQQYRIAERSVAAALVNGIDGPPISRTVRFGCSERRHLSESEQFRKG